MKKNYIFDNVDSLDGVYSIIQEHKEELCDLIPYAYFEHIQSLLGMNEEKIDKFLHYVHYVDHHFTKLGDVNQSSLLTILAGATYYQKFFSFVCDYTEDELSLLAFHSSFEDVDNYYQYLKQYPRTLLSTVSSRVSSFEARDFLLFWYDTSFRNGVDVDTLQNMLQNRDLNEIYDEANMMFDKLYDTVFSEEEMPSDSRRI